MMVAAAAPVGTTIKVRVEETWLTAGDVRVFRLRSDDALPGFTAGAHVNVQVRTHDGRDDWRRYSLVNLDPTPCATDSPADYLLAVRLDPASRGGSHHMHHAVQTGDTLVIEPPRNDFAHAAHKARSVLIAGGIGITPMASMAAHGRAIGQVLTLHYAGRSRASMAWLPELQTLLGDDLRVHADDEQGGPLGVADILAGCQLQDHVYVCGPQPMLDAVLRHTAQLGWGSERVHFELFSAPQGEAADKAFDVELAGSGRRLHVPADRTLLDVLNEAGYDVLFDCERGECGVCMVPVVSGDIDHRDYVLTENEKKKGQVMHPCVSRCKGPLLVLKL
ncbi:MULTISPECIES: PDR/VanB family oxidoreductase [unclassified Acidovorax]|uniref:PDR/VanB family oxidoreductase n=1 Tax=unclassified Acidovorax TaxID=2684926 RepID=UPI0028834A2D|nr:MULTISPECIES: PDR/VanB family oxidoreductase [unclassified Acidovorax]